MAAVAVPRLVYETQRLLFDTGPLGAIDLRVVQRLVREWFDGVNVYRERSGATYPPATLALLRPLEWLPFGVARWVWAVLFVGAVSGLAVVFIRAIGLTRPLEHAFVVLFLIASYPTAIALGNGQIIHFLLLALLTGLLILDRHPPGWGRDVLVGFLLLLSLAKPHVAVPFLWISLFAAGGIRPTILVAVGYLAATAFALSYSEIGLGELAADQVNRVARAPLWVVSINLQSMLASIGLRAWAAPASLAAFTGLGVWTYCNRHRDVWLRLGTAAIVARLWSWHGIYDDVLLAIPLVAIARRARSRGVTRRGLLAGVLIALSWLALLFPATPLREESFVGFALSSAQALLWLALLAFLLAETRADGKCEPADTVEGKSP